jgi:GNAT superfamily N-acetyltransferase
MKGAPEEGTEIREVSDENEAAECYPLMKQLRPHLATEGEFIERWHRQRMAGYRLLGLWCGGKLVALAGFRVIENLVHGMHLYVDDLVTTEEARGRGHGAELLRRLRAEGRLLGCAKLLLDTPLANVLAHRFYYRNGLLATALRFAEVLEE